MERYRNGFGLGQIRRAPKDARWRTYDQHYDGYNFVNVVIPMCYHHNCFRVCKVCGKKTFDTENGTTIRSPFRINTIAELGERMRQMAMDKFTAVYRSYLDAVEEYPDVDVLLDDDFIELSTVLPFDDMTFHIDKIDRVGLQLEDFFEPSLFTELVPEVVISLPSEIAPINVLGSNVSGALPVMSLPEDLGVKILPRGTQGVARRSRSKTSIIAAASKLDGEEESRMYTHRRRRSFRVLNNSDARICLNDLALQPLSLSSYNQWVFDPGGMECTHSIVKKWQ